MKGRYEIELYNAVVHYFLAVERNITILQGDSASGKTELIRLLTEYSRSGKSSGITLLCDKVCSVLTADDWTLRLGGMRDRIIFIDEENSFVRTKEFAQAVDGSDNYFVLICRDSLHELPYSILEIYGLRESSPSKYKQAEHVYNEMYQLYSAFPDEGIGWYSDDSKTAAVYRVYNPNAYANNHHFTTSAGERNVLVKLGWRNEGIGWYAVK